MRKNYFSEEKMRKSAFDRQMMVLKNVVAIDMMVLKSV